MSAIAASGWDKFAQQMGITPLKKDPTKAKVRYGLVGLGMVAGAHHVPGLSIDERTIITVVCDSDAALVHKRVEEWGPLNPGLRGTTDFLEVARDPNVDVVIIATPNFLHAEQVNEVLKNKKHILCEKPLGHQGAEAMQMAENAKKAGVVHMTAFTYRFTPAVRYLKHLVDSGELGDARIFRSQRFLDLPESSNGWRQSKKLAGAGYIYDMTTHRFDFAQYILGPLKEVTGDAAQFVPRDRDAAGNSCAPSEVDDYAAVLGRFESGAKGVWEGTTLMKGYHYDGLGKEWAEVVGSKATAVYQLSDPNSILFGGSGETMRPRPVPREFLTWPGSPRDPTLGKPSAIFRLDIVWEMTSAVVERRAAVPDFFDGAHAQAIADAVLEMSGRSETWRPVPAPSRGVKRVAEVALDAQTSKRSRSSLRLEGKKALITGGGSGMGRGIALAFAAEGADVVICGRRPDALAQTVDAAASCTGVVTAMVCDQSDSAAVAKVVQDAKDKLGRIDILVNNAGTNIPVRKLKDVSVDDFEKVLDTNLKGCFFFCHSVLPLMRAQAGGTVLNVSSIAGMRASVLAGSSYCASKFGMNALGNSINLEESENGIRCTNICPGETATEILDKRANPPPPEVRRKMVQPEDIAEVAVVAASLPPRVIIPHMSITGTTTIDLSM